MKTLQYDRTALAGVVTFLAFAAFQASAAGTWTTSSWNGGFTAATNNILRGKSPDNPAAAANALVNPNNNNPITEGSCSYATLTDGAAGVKDKTKTIAIPSNCSLSYALGEASTVNEIRIYSTWSDAGRDTLSVASVTAETTGGETVTLSPGSVSHSGDNNCACATLRMADGSALCENAVKVTFNFGAQENGYVGYSELEVVINSEIVLSKPVEITAANDITISSTPAEAVIYAPMGGNLTITGSGTVVQQNLPEDNTTTDGTAFGSYWPWGEGIVTVENGATLTSDTELFWGGATDERKYTDLTRKLVVQSGASATFSPASGEVCICGTWATKAEHAWVVVTGSGSTLTLPDKVYLSNRNRSPEGHPGRLDILDGAYVEMGTFYAGHCGGTLVLNVNDGTLKATGGIYCYKWNNRWTGGTYTFKDCLVETPVFQITYPASAFCGDTVTFDGAVFKAIGTPAAKFIDGPPAIADKNAKMYVAGNGLIVDIPSGVSTEVSALLQGAGGFTKRGAGTVTLSAPNTYTGATTIETGTLNVTGAIAGDLSVSNGATCAVSLAAAPSLGAVSVAGTATFSMPFTATSLALSAGGSLTVAGVGANVGSVSDCAGDFVIAGVAEWPRNTAIVSSSTDAFLEKVAASLNVSETIPSGFEFTVKEGTVQLVEAGLVNGKLTWTGAAGDTLWGSTGNWDDAGRAIASGDALVVAVGGVSTNDLGAIVVESATFPAGTAAHVAGASGASDSLKINGSVSNLSANAQTFDLPVSIGEAAFAVDATGDIVFRQGLAAATGVTPTVTKTGAGTLTVQGAAWGGLFDFAAGEALFTNVAAGTFSSIATFVANATTLRFAGPDTVVTQNVNSAAGSGNYWPWNGGTVVVEDGATLASDTQLFRGSGVEDNANKDLTRKLVVRSGATATFAPASGFVDIIGVQNSGYENAWTVVTGSGSTLSLPANVYLGNKSDYAGHGGGMDVLDGGHVEMGTFYVGHHCGTLRLNVDGGSLRAIGGIYGFRSGSRWTGATILFKDCVVETPFYKMAYPHANGGSTVTFNGAVFKPVGTPAAKFIDASPTGDARCPHYVTGEGLIVDAPEGSDLVVSAKLVGDGGFTKLGPGAATLSATNSYTGATVVSNGTLRLMGVVAGPIEVAAGATLALSLPEQDDVPVVPSLTVEEGAALEACQTALPEGERFVRVISSDSPIALPPQDRDAAGNVFFVKNAGAGGVLCYGRTLGLQVLVR